MMESTERTCSETAHRSLQPQAIQTTLYDLIAALSAEVPHDDDDVLTATVVHLLHTYRVICTGTLAGYQLVCDAGEYSAWPLPSVAHLSSSMNLQERT